MSVGDGLEPLAIAAGGLEAEVLPYGAHLVRLGVPGADGVSASVVLSLPAVADYTDRDRNPYVGSVVGRWANRIGGARFPLDYHPVKVVANEGPNQLHGGPEGFDRRIWQVRRHDPDRVVLELVSPDGDQGFPGTVTAIADYRLDPGGDDRPPAMELVLTATADASTPVNMTTHTYWNLSGDPAASVDDHRLTVPAAWTVEVDEGLLPTGRLPEVAGTPLDLRHGPRVGDVLDGLAPAGLDRCFVLTHELGREAVGLRPAARLVDPASGRAIEVATNQPAVHVYVPSGPVAGRPPRGGVCLETGALPDALNRPGFKPKVLRPNGEYRHVHRVTFPRP